ncbi:hypothetical protein DM01DRAFT_1122925 [Hesseltinella vesiculosa]|uniref:Uncharacterized protein n=1 Tax=Hesseltinella vesiculosa TaxID=101127 RepID=A0A1X2GTV5_9FUNG|nr:hypothetical protein DM01DRAFT_1122925 [Hesseltinella vesiculosa]
MTWLLGTWLYLCFWVVNAQSNGFNGNEGSAAAPKQESWLQQDHRYVFVIVLGLLFLAVIIYYIVRSARNMRKRLAKENQAQLDMIQSVVSSPQSVKSPDSAFPPLHNEKRY